MGFIDRDATDVLKLPCDCPGKPHGEDEYVYRTQFSYGERLKVGQAGLGDGALDLQAQQEALLRLALVGWNKVGRDGPVPLGPATIALLDERTGDLLASAIDEHFNREDGADTSPFEAASPVSSSDNGSSTPTTPTPGPSTTS